MPNFKVPDMLPPDYISAVRVDRRRGWRQVIDQSVKYFEKTNQDAKLMDATFNQAYTLMTSAKAREAFELTQESDETRKRYGMTRFGQGCLLARRLVERGVRFVTVNMFETVFNDITWDIHGSAPFSPIQCYSDLVGPMFDNAYSSLLEDLSDRGLLKSTLVVASGEFGRTPRINPPADATTGRSAGPSSWPGAASRVGRWWARPTTSAAHPRIARSCPPTWRLRFTNASESPSIPNSRLRRAA